MTVIELRDKLQNLIDKGCGDLPVVVDCVDVSVIRICEMDDGDGVEIA
jgi:hypothetical protein